MWKRNRSRAALLLLCAHGSFAGTTALERFEAVEPHMGTLFRITLYAPDVDTAHAGFTAAFRRVTAIEAALSDYRDDSELMRLCRESEGRPVPLGRDLFRVLLHAQEIARQTHGAFDVTLGPVTWLWREARRQGRLPEKSAIEAALARCGYQRLRIDKQLRTATLQRGMLLDLGGIAKGYAAEEALRELRARGLRRALVAASGDLAIGDAPPDAPGWRVGIATSDRALMLHNTAVSTSGDAEQHLDSAGARYSHIIDPRTGMGLTGSLTVTVVAHDGMTADALATALSVMGRQPAAQWLQRHRGAVGYFN